jgi:large subunit ribosomal protein L9
MKVLLLEDVYKLGRAGDVKKVADGYGRNFLLPQGLAVLATPGALKQVEHIRTRATASRSALNQEMSGVAERLSKLTLGFPARAGETGKLYGSISTQMIAEAIQKKVDVTIDRRQIDAQPIRSLGDQKVRVRLTVDLVPEIRVVVYREGETVDLGEEAVAVESQPEEEAPVEATPKASAETSVETSASAEAGASAEEESVEASDETSASAEAEASAAEAEAAG